MFLCKHSLFLYYDLDYIKEEVGNDTSLLFVYSMFYKSFLLHENRFLIKNQTTKGLKWMDVNKPNRCDIDNRCKFSYGQRFGAGPDVGLRLLDGWSLLFCGEGLMEHTQPWKELIKCLDVIWNKMIWSKVRHFKKIKRT